MSNTNFEKLNIFVFIWEFDKRKTENVHNEKGQMKKNNPK